MTDVEGVQTWDQIKSSAFETIIFDSSTSRRIPFLKNLSKVINDGSFVSDDEDKKSLQLISINLLKTYNYYQDLNSRTQLLLTLESLVGFNSNYLSGYLKFITGIITTSHSLAITDYLTLLSWINRFLELYYELGLSNQDLLQNLIVNQSLILNDAINATTNSKHSQHIRRIYDSIIASTKYSIIVGLKSDGSLINELVNILLSSSLTKDNLSLILNYVGIISSSVVEIQPTNPSIFEQFSGITDKIILFYTSQVLLTKVPPSDKALINFHQFFGYNFIDNDTMIQNIIPQLDKAILRSSEISFNHLTVPLFKHLNSNIDFSEILIGSKFLSNLFGGCKSVKPQVRVNSSATLELIIKNFIPKMSTGDYNKLINEIFKVFKATSNADIKFDIVNILSFISRSEMSVKILTDLLPIVSKDQNEVSLVGLVHAYINHFFKVLLDSNIETKFTTQIICGLSDKKVALRRFWFNELGNYLLSTKPVNLVNDNLKQFVNDIYPTLLQSLVEAQKAPLPSVTNKGISCAYVTISLTSLFLEHKLLTSDINNVYISSLEDREDKFSILISSKVITKLTCNDLSWCAKSLIASLSYVESISDDNKLSYGLAWLYFAASDSVPYNVRNETLDLIKLGFNSHPQAFSSILLKSIHKLLSDLDAKIIDNDLFRYNLRFISPIISIITQSSEIELIKTNLIQSLIISNHPQIPIKSEWVGLIQRSGYSLDVGDLVSDYIDTIIGDVYANLAGNTEGEVYKASIKALGVAAFIKPDVIGPRIASLLKDDLTLPNLSNSDIEIWRGEEGKLVVDVLNDKKSHNTSSSNKNADAKWEEELRKELAAKNKGKSNVPAKKLTKQEQTLVNEQIAKESEIRANVQTTVNAVTRSLFIIKELTKNAAQIDNGVKYWYPVAINQTLSILFNETNFGFLDKAFIIDVYINLSDLFSSRLGLLKPFVGVAILRINEVQNLPEQYTEEPLIHLLGRILFRIKILSDQRPLDSISLSYLLPLITKVLENGQQVAIKNSSKQAVTSEFVEEDPEEEQLLLAIEIISSHSEIFEDDSIPRTRILEVLISLMGLASKAKLAKDCFLALCQHISVNISDSDLSLLLSSLITPKSFVKNSILEGLDSEFELHHLKYSSEIWINVHDDDANISEIASTIWQDNEFEITPDAPVQLLKFAGDKNPGIRLSIAQAIASAVKANASIFSESLDSLISLYKEKENPPPLKKDEYGLVIRTKVDQKDCWEERSTVALTLLYLSPLFNDQGEIEKVFKFFVNEEALGDKEPLVRQELQEAGVEIIKSHGLENIEVLIPIFEACLAEKDNGTKKQDNIRECVIILYGAIGRHLDPSDERLNLIVDRLIKTLKTPSEDVQYAISECIAPLVKSFKDKLQDYFDQLFDTLFTSKKMASRRGAAYGIAGLVKGAGLKSLATYDIMRTLIDAADDKKDPARREGVSFVFECLSLSLGKFFEPYVIEILPILLKSLGDAVPEVREATDMAAREIMKNTTSYGVKKLIPVAIGNLDEIAWRSKKGSVELLGSMAYLDPTQLSASLSTIVPEIVGVLNDSHKEVRKAADQSLKRFGEVIRNPEIQVIVPDLINAIGDPTKYTDPALDKLIKTQFVHYIDGPSLALIIHVIHRGMRDRSASTKKKACQIVGNMAILVDSKDLRPYLPQLVEELEVAMVDPVPATRSTAARALGSLVEKLGENQFPDLIPRLLLTLQDESKAGDRLGSAQALSEVICGLGIDKLEDLLPTILNNAVSPRSAIRAGFMPLLLFLPVCFGAQFSPYLTKIIPPILAGLADVDEDIRETAIKAGRLIVKNYAKKAVDILLPELETGIFDTNYRIRLSSLELTGDLLFQVTGISGKSELGEDQVDHSSEINKSLIDVLGQERRDRVLSSLFICRSDTTGIVRSAAVDIWKALVANTPRTVKEILPTLTSIIVKRLAANDESQRAIAASTLGEMVRRVGANALDQLMPTLENNLISGDTDTKQGICIALTELIQSASSDVLNEYQHAFIKITRDALIDSSPQVRESAAQSFQALQEELGKVVIDEIIPYLLNLLQSSDDSENALSALQDIMTTKSEIIFPILIPTLLTPPIDAFKVKALSALASVAGSALYKRLSSIINTLMQAVIDSRSESEEYQEEIKSSFDKILLSIDSDAGIHPLMQQLLSLIKHEDPVKRSIIYERLGNFFKDTSLDYSMYTQDMVQQFILSLDDKSPQVVQGTFDALSALVKSQSKESLEKLVKPAYQSLVLTGVKGEEIAGFQLNRGPNCILPIFLHGLMYGNNEQKELSALSIADIIDKTPATILKPFATIITGPLIRVIGEKVTSDIKVGILIALTNLLKKIPQFLRPFIPQLQRTFVRSLGDTNNEVLREKAVIAMGVLIEYQPRVDSLVTELVTGAKNSDDNGVKMSMLKAMLEVINKSGSKMSENSKVAIMGLIEEEIDNNLHNEKAVVSYARIIGSISTILSVDESKVIIENKILKLNLSEQETKVNLSSDLKFSILLINSFLKESPQHFFQSSLVEDLLEFLITCCKSKFDYISDNSVIAIGKILLQISPDKKGNAGKYEIDDEAIESLVNQLCSSMLVPASNSNDTRRLSLVVIRTVARFNYELLIKPNWDSIIPSIFTCVRDSIIPVKLAAEKAYLAAFNLVDDVNSADFNSWFNEKSANGATIDNLVGATIQLRSIGDYTKRVASRLANVERERIEAGGDEETMFSDRFEDEQEVWAVGGVDISK